VGKMLAETAEIQISLACLMSTPLAFASEGGSRKLVRFTSVDAEL